MHGEEGVQLVHDKHNRCGFSLECRLFLMASGFFPFSQAVPYSRDFKRKCDYFRSKLKRPVSVVSCWCVCGLFLLISLLTYCI